MNGQICSLPSRWRTVWASDLHLGARDSADREFAAALNVLDCDALHLVGDTLDFWKLRRSWWVHWPHSHNNVLRAIKRKIDAGTEVLLFRGNHDEELRGLCGKEVGIKDLVDLVLADMGKRTSRWWLRRYGVDLEEFASWESRGIRVMEDLVYPNADKRLRLLVLHGDQFDGVMQNCKWLAYVADTGYSAALFVNRWFNWLGSFVHLPYISISRRLKWIAKGAMQYVSRFEELVAEEARRRGANAVVAGHIHHGQIRHIDGILYCNDGDFVEGRNLLAEDYQGNLWLLYYDSRKRKLVPVLYYRSKTDQVLPPPETMPAADLVEV